MNAGELHRLARQLREIATRATQASGEDMPSLSEVAIVEDVARHPGSAIKEITERVRLAQSLVSKVVAQMQQEGIFVTETDPHDKRRVRVSVEPQVREKVLKPRGIQPIKASLKAVYPQLSAEQSAQVVKALEEVADLLGEHKRSSA